MIVGVIPARYGSARFPGKPLARIGEQTMIQRVYLQAKKAKRLHDIVVATDHEEIFQSIREIDGKAIMTSERHRNGTSRCAEAAETFDAHHFINIQGDEPFIDPDEIDLLASLVMEEVQIATLKTSVSRTQDILNPNVVKVVSDKEGKAMYFSRSPIPYFEEKRNPQAAYFKHIGIYAYRKDVLQEIVTLPVSPLESSESLEQLRWLENGYPVWVRETTSEHFAIDTPADMQQALELIKNELKK